MSRSRHKQKFFPADAYARYPPLEPFTHVEHGKDADPSFKDLLRDATSVERITPTTGTEVHGVQLSGLTKEGKDQLALLVAQRKVVGEFVRSSFRPRYGRLTPSHAQSSEIKTSRTSQSRTR